MKKSLVSSVVVVVLLMSMIGLGIAKGSDFVVGLVTDLNGVDDKMFNTLAWQGVVEATTELGITGKYLESSTPADYLPNINALVQDGADLVVTVGFGQADATENAALAHPDKLFAIVDYTFEPELENVVGITFDPTDASFLAGYVAASVTKTGILGVYGGMNIEPITTFMDGFYWGVQYYNEKNGTDHYVMGWDPQNPSTGLFTGNFESLEDGRTFGRNLIEEGADVIFPVAGPVNFGTAAVAQEYGGVILIGGDVDQAIVSPEYADLYLTSVLKNTDIAIKQVIEDAQDGSFEENTFVGTLVNGGVGISPFHNFENIVSDKVKQELIEIEKGLIDATIVVRQ